ncbi:MAG: hypothetical protein WBH10_10480 [Allopontixanthobacter sediminis]
MTKPKSELADANTEMTSAHLASRKLYSSILMALTLLAVVFGAGVVSGYLDAGGGDRADVLLGIVIAWVSVVAGLAVLAARVWPKHAKEPISRSSRRSRNLIYVLVAVGAVLGLLLGYNEPEGISLLSSGPIPAFPALVAIGLWVICAPIVTLMWWRSTDEHDRASYTDGANVAGHAYLFIVPSWWVATRAGVLPEQDPIIVLLIVATIWSAVWLYRRYF